VRCNRAEIPAESREERDVTSSEEQDKKTNAMSHTRSYANVPFRDPLPP